MTDTTDDIAEEISFQAFEDDCRLLGSLLIDVLNREVGPQFMENVERKRILAQSAISMRNAGMESTAELLEKLLSEEISKMTLEEALALARAFSHYLNLMGIAETHHRVRKARNDINLSKSCDDSFGKLINGGVSDDQLFESVCNQEIEIVLTAHPTQINRRTLQYKHIRIAHLLEFNGRPDLSHEDRDMLIEDLMREITSLWQTDELRRHKPTPVDEARAWLNVSNKRQWLVFYRVNGMLLYGKGLIDGKGQKWWNLPCKPHKGINGTTLPGPCDSPVALKFFMSSNITVQGLQIKNSPQFPVKTSP